MPDPTYSEEKTAGLRAAVTAWENADGPAREHDPAEAFTRLWAELDTYYATGGELTPEWAAAHPPLRPPLDSGIPHVRVYVQDTRGAWWLPEPAAAILHMLEAATADTTLAAITAEERSRIRDAMDELSDAFDPEGPLMGTGYEHLNDAKFWAEVLELLELIQRHAPAGTPLEAGTGRLADYVRDEAERRDPVLDTARTRQVELIRQAWDREGFDPALSLAADVPFTPAEASEWETLHAAYALRVARWAKAGGDPNRRIEIRIVRGPAHLRGQNYRGRTADTIARRLFGASAEARPSPDPNNHGQGMITRTDRHGTHVLAGYVEH